MKVDIIFIFFRISKEKLAVIDCFQSFFFLLRLAVAKAFCQIETYDFAITCYAIILPLSLTLLFYLGFWHVLLPFIVYYIEEGQRKFFVHSVATLFLRVLTQYSLHAMEYQCHVSQTFVQKHKLASHEVENNDKIFLQVKA